MVLRLAWRNVWRNPRRTLVVVTAIAVGISGCLVAMAVNFGMVAEMIDTAIASGLGHIQIHASGWDEKPELKVRLDDGGASLRTVLDEAPDIRAWAPRLRSEGLVASPRGSVGVTIIGVDPAREPKISETADSITEGEWLGERRRVVIGEALARRLKVGVGSKVVLTVQDLTAELTGQAFRVSGLMNTRSRDLDDGTVLMRIAEAQALLGMGAAISEVVITAIDRRDIAAIHARLEATLGAASEVRTWEQLVPLLVYMVDTFDSMGLVLYAAIFIAMSFGIANVLMMAVYERTREIGMMRAMGMGRGRVVAMVIVESCFVTALGLAVGIGLALLGVAALSDGIDISRFADSMDAYGMGTLLKPVVRAQDFASPILVGSVTAVLAGLWPAYRASRANPADALRHY